MENSVNDLDTGQDPPQKKFVPTKQKFAAKKAAQKKKKSLENSRVTKDGEDERFTNATTSLSSPKLNTEVRRGGWNRPLSSPVSPLESVPLHPGPGGPYFGEGAPPPKSTRNVQMLKIGLGILGGIALLLGSLASFLYISRKQRRRKRIAQKRAARAELANHRPSQFSAPGGSSAPFYQNSSSPEYSQYPPNGWQNAMNPYNQQYFNQIGPYQNQPNPCHPQNPYYQMQYDPYQAYNMPGYYPQMAGYGEMGVGMTYGNGEYPESQAGMSEVGFDPVLNYVETLGDELKTPKRKPKHRKEGSSTPHPIITRRTSCKSIKSEVSAWTEDEETLSKAESTYVSQENVSMKVVGSEASAKEMIETVQEESTSQTSQKSSPQLSQTNDSAYGSRGSIQSPNSNVLQTIPPFKGSPDSKNFDPKDFGSKNFVKFSSAQFIDDKLEQNFVNNNNEKQQPDEVTNSCIEDNKTETRSVC